MTDTELLAWGRQELDRQMDTDNTCHVCGAVATDRGYARWSSCTFCGQPVCDTCAVQANDGHFCPTCPHTTPF